MKKIFYFGITGLALFEFLKVYFIMPMPGSQRMETLDIAYFLHSYRWFFRIVFGAMAAVGLFAAFKTPRKWVWVPTVALLAAGTVTWLFNFKMTADSMFQQPQKLTLKPRPDNVMNDSSIVLGIEHEGDARAYPVRFLTYHHQVQDTVGGEPVIVTYCSVCRTGRVFEPVVNGQRETFRLVGMDHFNAMFEDATTKSWWRQVTGEAVAGKLKGQALPEVESVQMTLGKWFELYPNGKVMQPDEASLVEYDSLGKFERGKSKSDLTRTDSLSWKENSWVVGIQTGGTSKAYDWNQLKQDRLIHDRIGQTPIVLALASDGMSFMAFERPSDNLFTLRNDTLFFEGSSFDFSGRNLNPLGPTLKRVPAHQEFWHSWRTFHPGTLKY
ncbi:MAG: DUF3179 domain-containing protein [Bacteroidetes bacterium]|nr:DUF3179 domain-containing protein [Bacteroidota bacterium]